MLIHRGVHLGFDSHIHRFRCYNFRRYPRKGVVAERFISFINLNTMYYGTLLANAIPTVPLDKGVRQAVTGNLLMDLLPLITMAPCIPTLVLFWRKQRLNDFLLFGVGFSLAIAYHVAHIDGIEQSTLLGLPGAVWRSLDIFVAQSLLSRTLGHAIGAHTSFVASEAICNCLNCLPSLTAHVLR